MIRLKLLLLRHSHNGSSIPPGTWDIADDLFAATLLSRISSEYLFKMSVIHLFHDTIIRSGGHNIA